MKQYEVAGHAPSLVPEGKNWKLVFSDEFDGRELDRSKWDFRREIMGTWHKAWCGEEGVELDGQSNCVFKLIEKEGEVCSAQLQTGYNFMDAVKDDAGTKYSGGLNWPIAPLKENKYLHAHGYYECRCRLQRQEGWWSAFWLQSPIIGASLNPAQAGVEIDVMESFHPGDVIDHYCHFDGYGKDHKCHHEGKGAKGLNLDEYHTFAVEWDETGYTFYIDGEEDGHVDGPVSDCPEFILVGTEVMGYRNADHAPTPEARAAAKAGDCFVVDYVRVFDAE